MAGQKQLASWNGVSRREALRLGGLTALGLSLPQVLRAQQATKPKREVNCILLWMLGGPSHIDMYDLKPNAPSEIRGELRPIPTNVPGTHIGELMPNMAKCADKFSIIRSMHSYTGSHGQGDHHLMSGNRWTKTIIPPGFGAMIAHQQEQRARETPPFVQLGTITSTNFGVPGQGGYLGRPYDPFIVEPDPNSASFKVNAFSSPLAGNRMDYRKGLLNALDTFHAKTEHQQAFARTYDEFQERAFGLITSTTVSYTHLTLPTILLV